MSDSEGGPNSMEEARRMFLGHVGNVREALGTSAEDRLALRVGREALALARELVGELRDGTAEAWLAQVPGDLQRVGLTRIGLSVMEALQASEEGL